MSVMDSQKCYALKCCLNKALINGFIPARIPFVTCISDFKLAAYNNSHQSIYFIKVILNTILNYIPRGNIVFVVNITLPILPGYIARGPPLIQIMDYFLVNR